MVPVAKKQRKYFVREKFLLKACGVSIVGNDSNAYKIYSLFMLLVFNYPYPFVTANDLFKHGLDGMAEIGVYFCGSCMGLTLTTVMLRKRKQLINLFDRLEEEPFLPNPERGGDEEERLINQWLRFTNIQSLAFYIAGMGSVCFQVIYTLCKRIRSNDYHDWSFGFGPLTLVNVTYSPNYEIAWAYQNISILCLVGAMLSSTLIMATSLNLIATQYRILQHNLRRIVEHSYGKMVQDNGINPPRPKGMDLDASTIPWKYLQTSITEMIEYHLSINKIAKELEQIFGVAMLAIFANSLTTCFEIYRSTSMSISDVRMLRLLVESVSACFLPFMMCYCGEQIAIESEAVGWAAYQSNFVGTDLRFQRALVVIIRRSQYPMRMKAAKLIETSLANFTTILRASYSVFTVLRNAGTNDKYLKQY